MVGLRGIGITCTTITTESFFKEPNNFSFEINSDFFNDDVDIDPPILIPAILKWQINSFV